MANYLIAFHQFKEFLEMIVMQENLEHVVIKDTEHYCANEVSWLQSTETNSGWYRGQGKGRTDWKDMEDRRINEKLENYTLN